MEIYYCIYVLALGATLPAAINDGRWRRLLLKICIPLLLAVLLLFAALRSPTADRDYMNYLSWFDRVAAGGMTALDWVKDPGFVLILKVAAMLRVGYLGATFLLDALTLAGTACFALLACRERCLSIFIYLYTCRFFLGQITTIRAGVAIALLSLSLLSMYRGRRVRAVVLLFLSVTFHLSVLFALPVVLLAMFRVSFKSRWWIGAMIPLVVVLRILAGNILETISQFDRVSPYVNGGVNADGVRLLSVYVIIRVIVMCFVVLLLWGKVSSEERLAVFCSVAGLFLQILFASNGTIALRSSDLFALFDVMLFVIPLRYLRGVPARSAYMLLLVIMGFKFYVSALELFSPYHWIFG
jgi:hypothetical protein